MKNLNLIFGTLVIIFTTVFIYSCAKDGNTHEKQNNFLSSSQIEELKSTLGFDENVETRSAMAGASCGNTTQGCFLLQAGKTDTFLIPGTTCYASATYDLYRCLNTTGATIVTHIFNNFSTFPIVGMGCDSILNSWDSLLNVGNFNEFSYQLDLFNAIATEIVEQNYNKQLFTSSFFQSFFNCEQFNTLLFSEFYLDNCFKWCVGNKIVDGRPVRDYQRRTCGESCCKRTTAYCWSAAKQKVIESSPVVEQIGNCESSSSIENCPAGYYTLGSCQHQCFPKK